MGTVLAVCVALLGVMLLFSGASQPTPVPPTTVYGYVYADDGETPLEGAVVQGVNPTTLEDQTYTTNDEGEYILTFHNYTDGDTVEITVSYQGESESATATLDHIENPTQQLDFTMADISATIDDGEDGFPTLYLALAGLAVVVVIILVLILSKSRKDEKEE